MDAFDAGAGHAIHVLGNHDYDRSHTAEDCIEAWGIPDRHYALERRGVSVIVLDGNERGSPTRGKHGGYPSHIGPRQQAWLDDQLERVHGPALILSHQPLAGRSAIDNDAEVRAVIAKHRHKGALCLNGHSHIDQQVVHDEVPYVHINSASYFWLGGKPRWAASREPRFARLRIDPAAQRIEIEGVSSDWLGETPQRAGDFDRPGSAPRQVMVPKIRSRVLHDAPTT